MNDLVSIIIACRSCREYIGEAIESALAQTYDPTETLVLENCGNDGTYEEALKYSDPRLRVMRNERDLGLYVNKNHGVNLTQGPLIKFLDGDDVLETRGVENLVRAYEKSGPGVGMVLGQYANIGPKGEAQASPRHWGIEGRCSGMKLLDVVTRMMPGGSMFGNPTPHLLDREVMNKAGGFSDANSFIGDLELFLKMLCFGDAVFVPEVVARYRRQPGSLTGTTRGLLVLKDTLNTIDRLEAFFAGQPVPAHLKDPEFFNQWRLGAGSRFLILDYVKRVRGKPNQFEEIRQEYHARGLGDAADRFFKRRIVPHTLGLYMNKLRARLGLHEMAPLFNRRHADLLKPEQFEHRSFSS